MMVAFLSLSKHEPTLSDSLQGPVQQDTPKADLIPVKLKPVSNTTSKYRVMLAVAFSAYLMYVQPIHYFGLYQLLRGNARFF